MAKSVTIVIKLETSLWLLT